MKYVELRGSTYCLQLPIPKDIQPLWGKRAIRTTLRTKDPLVAAKKAAPQVAYYRLQFEALRAGTQLQPKEIEEQAEKLLKSYGLKAGSVLNPEPNLDAFYNSLTEKRELYAQGDETAYDDPIEAYLSAKEVKAVELLNEPQDAPTDMRLSKTVAFYLSHHKEPTEKLQRDSDRAMGYLIDVVGNKKITELDRGDAHLFRDTLLTRNKTATVRRNLNALNAVITACYLELEINKASPFKAIKIPNEGHDKVDRIPLSTAEMVKLKPLLLEADNRLSHLIAIALDTGMRLSEMVGLRVEDIHLEAPIPYLEIQPYAFRRVKTPSSERSVPLVGMALWGVTQAIKEVPKGSPFVFPHWIDMVKKKTKADTVSAQGGKWLKKNLNNPKISNHSFRHTMIDRLREVGCPPEVFNAVTGWATDGMAKNYGDGYSLKKKQEWLSKVVF